MSLQKQLAEDGTKLEAALEASRGSVRLMLEEFQLSTQEQKNMIFEVSKCKQLAGVTGANPGV